MTNETTPSVISTASLSYILGRNTIPANLPTLVFHALAGDIDIAGMGTGAAQLANESDLGAASPGTYGTDVSTNTSVGYDAATTLTVVEGALVAAVVLDEAVARKYPGVTGVEMLMQEGTLQQKIAAHQPTVNRLSSMCLETYEVDHANLFSGLSNSVGDASPFSANTFLSGVYTFETLECPTTEMVFGGWPVQVRDLRQDVFTNGGGLPSGAWAQADIAALTAARLPTNGYRGTLLGVPIYQGSHSLRVLSTTSTSNDTVNGGFIAVGRGDPSNGGQLGAFIHARTGWLKTRMQYQARSRGMIVVVSLEYVAAEARDTAGVRAKSKST